MKRKHLLTMSAGLGLASTFAQGVFATEEAKANSKPNVLFFIVDDLRTQLGCYGKEEVISPNIDKLARQGVLFNKAYCQVPVCGASRASLLTGLRPTPKRFVSYYSKASKDAKGIIDLPGFFKKNGYHTISNGKVYHHKNDNKASWDEMYRPKDFCVYLSDENKRFMKSKDKRGLPYESIDVKDNAYPGGKLAEKVIKDLQKCKEDNKPYFITAGFTKPHLPFNAPKKYWDLYKAEDMKPYNYFKPKDAPERAIGKWGELRAYYGIPKNGPVSDEMAQKLVHGYNACVSFSDAMIGKIMAELDRLDMRKNTIVILIGDHGWQLGDHTMWCKHANFNTSLQAPMIVSAPGMKKNVKCNALTEYVDIYPTLCELAGLELPSHLQGTSFVPLLKNPDERWKKAVYSRYHKGESVRTDRYLYSEWDSNTRMLYDHQKDPNENVNISEKPENKEIVEAMQLLLNDHRRKYYK